MTGPRIQPPKLRAALYYRQSLDVQEGIERQRTRCKALVQAREWKVFEEYVDNDTSASKVRGAGTSWSRMLSDARAGLFDVVVAVNFDRLLRTQKDLIALIESGALVTTLEGEIDLASASGEMQATVLTAMARFEARRKGERQVRANEHRAAKGLPARGRRPFGFEKDGVTLRPIEAEAVRSSYSDFLSGMPLAAIARKWNAQGLVTGQKRYGAAHKGEPSPWQAYSVRMVLTNARYAGKRVHLGEVVANGEWPAIVDDSTWQAVNAALRNPSRLSAPKRGKYLLSGLAVCGVCGAKAHAGGNARKGVPAYRCSGSTGHFARRAEPVDSYVQAVMVARLSKADAKTLLTTVKSPNVDAVQLEALGLRERLDTLAIDFADGAITSGQLRTATERLRSRLQATEDQLADAGRIDVLGPLINAADANEAWEALDTSARRSVISILAKVVLHPVGRGTRNFDPDTVGIEWLT
jgi:site-specific DNA recombinase